MTSRLRLRRASDGRTVDLGADAQLGAGGEGRVLRVSSWPGSVAKVYHEPTAERERKIRAMLAHPPDDPGVHRAALCWPTDLLQDASSDRFVGFLMPLLPRFDPVFTLYNPGARRRQRPLTTWADLHDVAGQVATVMGAVHAIDAVVGDINESNTVVDDDRHVTLVDCDSFRIRDPGTGTVYRSPVAKPEYTSPELQGKSMAEVQQTVEDDLFGLAVLLFQLLMEGMHPYEGVLHGRGEPEPYGARIAAGYLPWAPGRGGPYGPKPLSVPLDVLHPALRSAFVRCFVDGHARPEARPAASAWAMVIRTAASDLRRCATNDQHRYGGHRAACPWCERRDALGGLDPFPSRSAIEAGEHLAPGVSRQRPAPRHAPAPIVTAPPVARAGSAPVPAIRARRFRAALVLLVLLVGIGVAVQSAMGPGGGPASEAPPSAGELPLGSTDRPPASPAAASARVAALLERGDMASIHDAARILNATGQRTKKGRTGLMLVARTGDPDAVRALLAAGDDANAHDDDGFTPLMLAANDGHLAAARVLLGAGAQVNAQDEEGYTALLFAVSDGHEDTVRALLTAGADPRLVTKEGWSPLISAASHGHEGTLRALLDAGAPTDHQDVRGCTALMAAAHQRSEGAVELLLDRGARPDVETGCGSAFALAVDAPCPGCARLIDRALAAQRLKP